MRRLILFAFAILFVGCTTVISPIKLAETPSTAIPPKAGFENGIYTLTGTGVTHVILLFPGGTINDPKGREGAVELLCSSMVSGGTKSLSPDQIDMELDRLALDISVSPQREYTIVGMSFLPDVSDRAIDLLTEIIKSPRLSPDRVELNRSLIKDGIIRKDDEAVEQAFRIYRQHYYRGDPRENSPTVKSVDAVTKADMLSLHKAIFSSKPLVGMIGNLDRKYTDTLQTAFTGSQAFSRLGPPPSPDYGSFSGRANQKQCVLLKVHQAANMTDSSYAACVAADMLIGSGGFNSMIVKNVRTKAGLAYSADSFYQARPLWGLFGIIIVTEPQALETVRKVLEETLSNAGADITDSDVAWAKNTIINRSATEYNTPSGIISHSMDYVFYGIPPDFDSKYLQQVAALTADDVRKAATNLIKGPWVDVVINSPQ